jgi:hypothetical protein
MAEDMLWHFLHPVPELVAHYESRHQAMVEAPQMLSDHYIPAPAPGVYTGRAASTG